MRVNVYYTGSPSVSLGLIFYLFTAIYAPMIFSGSLKNTSVLIIYNIYILNLMIMAGFNNYKSL